MLTECTVFIAAPCFVLWTLRQGLVPVTSALVEFASAANIAMQLSKWNNEVISSIRTSAGHSREQEEATISKELPRNQYYTD